MLLDTKSESCVLSVEKAVRIAEGSQDGSHSSTTDECCHPP